LEDLVARATTIVWGQVSGTESRWQSDERGRHIYTTVAISPVFASVKGQVQGPLSFEVVGGTVEGITESASHVPAFHEGEEAVVFLTGDPVRLIAGRSGKVRVYDGRVYWAGSGLPVEAFLEGLDLIAAGRSAEPVWRREAQRRVRDVSAGRPVIHSITPDRASAGTDTAITLTGSNFGDAGTVEFSPGIAAAEVLSWTNERIVCTVPSGGGSGSAESGPVTVTTSAGTSEGQIFRVTFGYGQVKWLGTSPTVRYYINENTPDCTGEADAVQRAAGTWQGGSGGAICLEYAGSHENTAPDLYNGRSEVMWGDTDSLATAYCKYNPRTGGILECDIVFDDSYTWSVADNCPSGSFDVESVALHEFGHGLQLLDLYGDVGDGEYDGAKVMFGRIRSGADKRDLHQDDQDGVQWIYSPQAPPPPPPPPPPPDYVDIGLRVYDGQDTVRIACEPAGTLTSPLRIAKHGTVYGIALVDPSDSSASAIRVATRSGVKALRRY